MCDDPLKQQPDELLALGGVVLSGPKLTEVRKQIDAALPVDVLNRADLGELAGELGFAAHVLVAGVVTEFVQVTSAFELPLDLLWGRPDGSASCFLVLGIAELKDLLALPFAADLERLDELADLSIKDVGERERLLA